MPKILGCMACKAHFVFATITLPKPGPSIVPKYCPYCGVQNGVYVEIKPKSIKEPLIGVQRD